MRCSVVCRAAAFVLGMLLAGLPAKAQDDVSADSLRVWDVALSSRLSASQAALLQLDGGRHQHAGLHRRRERQGTPPHAPLGADLRPASRARVHLGWRTVGGGP